MSGQQIFVTFVTVVFAGWCIALLVSACQWPLVVGCAIVPGGALVHAVVLAVRGHTKAADTLLTWTCASTVALVAFADAIRSGAGQCGP